MLKLKSLLTGGGIVAFVVVSFSPSAFAAEPVRSADVSTSVDSMLPDSPGAVQQGATSGGVVPQIAPRNRLTIKVGQTAQPLSAHNKFAIAFHNIASPTGFAFNVASAGVSHVENSRPYFGTDRAGFGERVGANVYRSNVKSLFAYGVFPVLFRDDPRYYVLGDTVPFKQRVLYAGTRLLLTRKDSGDRGINWPQLLAPIVSQGSAHGFYPSRDQDAGEATLGLFASYATTAGTYEAREFAADLLRKLHRKP